MRKFFWGKWKLVAFSEVNVFSRARLAVCEARERASGGEPVISL